jgi:hypothetical protein
MPDPNTLRIAPALGEQPLSIQPKLLAVSIPMAKLQRLAQVIGDENAPHFTSEQEPTRDGVFFSATDGHKYYRPNLRIAQRTLPPAGPNVRFLKDAAGAVSLHFELEEAPQTGIPTDGAEPLNVKVDQIRLTWTASGLSNQRVFEQPTLVPHDDPQNHATPNFSILVNAKLQPDEVEPLYNALRQPGSNAALEITLSYAYWKEQPGTPSTHHGGGPGHRFTFSALPLLAMTRAVATPTQPEIAPVPEETTVRSTIIARGARLRIMDTVREASVSPAAAAPAMRERLDLFRLDPDRIRVLESDENERKRKPDFQTVVLNRTLPFTFNPELPQNRPIYSAIIASEALTETWTQTPFGLIRKAAFPNTVYRLPDEIRLAYNTELGTPHVVPALYRTEDDSADTRVRVTLRAIPWHNPDQLVKLRDYLFESTSGALAAPQIVVGGYEEAKLKLTSAFPEHIHALNGEETPVDLTRGFDMTLDLTLEYYRFLCQLLTGGVGLTGQVSVSLEMPSTVSETPQKVTRGVEMRLNLADLANLPVNISVDEDTVSPKIVHITNGARYPMQIGDCIPRLLQYDENSVVPIGVFQAGAQTPTFPVTLEKEATLDVEIQPREEHREAFWNAVQIELIQQELTISPEDALNRIHEIAPSGSLSWKIAVEAPLFTRSPLPPQFQNLFSLEIQIQREGFAAQQVVLRPGQSEGQVTMQRTLRELLREDALGIGEFSYRVRNIYFDHQGKWSERKEAEGSSLFVFPNPVDGD